MTDTEILADLKKVLNKQFGVEEETVEEDSYLDEDLNLTEVEVEDFITALEEKYDIEIGIQMAQEFKKVSDIITYLYEKINSTG